MNENSNNFEDVINSLVEFIIRASKEGATSEEIMALQEVNFY